MVKPWVYAGLLGFVAFLVDFVLWLNFYSENILWLEIYFLPCFLGFDKGIFYGF